ncbi:RNA polymerase sigma factor [Alteromonas sp. H39]|uniref:RNA polymerase sigma factor n=1 Tax=Alteromonas sp. H39 TaxID=3389876 RepID=UPI0039E1FD56
MSAQILEQDVRLAMDGDSTAFTRLIQATRNTISSIALAVVKDLDASEEVTQQVYIQCWQKLSTLKNPASFMPWLRQSTRYAAFNYLRDNKVSQRASSEEADILFAQFCNDNDSVETELTRDQQAKVLARVVDELPRETREIVLLFYREEQSSAQVAQLLSISDDTVRQQLRRARQSLREKLLDRYGTVILSTAPTMAISATALIGGGFSTPVHAATSSVTGGSFWGAVKWLLSGAMLAAVVGALTVYISASIPLRHMQNEERKAALKKERNRTVVATLITGALWAAAYEFTAGWVAPVIAYQLMMGVIFVQTMKMQNMIIDEQKQRQAAPTRSLFGFCSGRFGLYAGVIVGNAAMFIGLYASGRPFF